MLPYKSYLLASFREQFLDIMKYLLRNPIVFDICQIKSWEYFDFNKDI